MIYCVEDDENIRDLIQYALKASGFPSKGFGDASAFFIELHQVKPDLVILDIMLPGEDGITILKKIRADSLTADIPVIMLTARTSEYDKIIGLDLGADDYVTKPFSVMELMSRVKAVLRRTNTQNAQDTLQLGCVTLDNQRHIVTVNSEEISLTNKEFELLRFLMKNPTIVFSRSTILESVWGYDYEGETRTVDMHVKTLRQKLGNAGNYIETVRGVGYKMNPERSAEHES